MALPTTFICFQTLDSSRGKSPILWSQNYMDLIFEKTAPQQDPNDTEREGRYKLQKERLKKCNNAMYTFYRSIICRRLGVKNNWEKQIFFATNSIHFYLFWLPNSLSIFLNIKDKTESVHVHCIGYFFPWCYVVEDKSKKLKIFILTILLKVRADLQIHVQLKMHNENNVCLQFLKGCPHD